MKHRPNASAALVQTNWPKAFALYSISQVPVDTQPGYQYLTLPQPAAVVRALQQSSRSIRNENGLHFENIGDRIRCTGQYVWCGLPPGLTWSKAGSSWNKGLQEHKWGLSGLH